MAKKSTHSRRFSKHQTIVKTVPVYNEDGSLSHNTIEWMIPEFITSDVTFQLQFGFSPGDNWEPTRTMQSYSLGSQYLKANNTKFYKQ